MSSAASRKWIALVLLCATQFLVVLDVAIVNVALPSIQTALDFSQEDLQWVVSAYTLTFGGLLLLGGRAADLLGRRRVFMVGLVLFSLASLACGLANSDTFLITARAIQGIGAAIISPAALSILVTTFDEGAERNKALGIWGAIAGIGGAAGVLFGGVLTDTLGWEWIFFVNVPLAGLAAWLLVRSFHETVPRTTHRIDWAGGLLLTVGLSLLLLALLEGGNVWAWASTPSLAAFGAGGALLAAFALVERRAAEPVLPLWVLSRRLLGTTALVGLGVGVVLMGVTTYVPTFLETLTGLSPLASGLTLAMLTIGWPISAANAGRVYLRIGFRRTVLIGGTVTILGAALLAATSRTPSPVAVGLACFLLGLGLGFVAAPSLIAAQASVEWGQRGVVTGANMFARSIGSAMGVAAIGALVNGLMGGQSAAADPTQFGVAATAAFTAVLGAAVLTTLVALAMPRDTPSSRAVARDALHARPA